MPSPFEAGLLALAAWRVWHLLADDLILDRPRRYVTARWGKTEDFIECPFCLGFWVALLWVGAFSVWPSGTVWAALVFAVASVPPLVNHWLTSD